MLHAIWGRLKAACARSLTIAWSYLLGVFGLAMQYVDNLATLAGDAAFTQQVQNIIGADPKVLGRYLSMTAVITIVSRLRGVLAARKS
jgi:hypothetical protein